MLIWRSKDYLKIIFCSIGLFVILLSFIYIFFKNRNRMFFLLFKCFYTNHLIVKNEPRWSSNWFFLSFFYNFLFMICFLEISLTSPNIHIISCFRLFFFLIYIYINSNVFILFIYFAFKFLKTFQCHIVFQLRWIVIY